jgi:TP901 family phage tail tape measure protein
MADIKTVQLIVNSEQAKKKLDEINQKLDVAKKKKHDAFLVGDAKGIEVYSKEIKKLETQLKNAQTRGETIAKTLKNLDKATPNELKATIREVTKELNSGKVARGSQEWEKLNDALRECNGELKKIKEESKAAKGLTKSIIDFGNDWVGIIGSIQMGWDVISNIKASGSAVVNAYAEMAEAESQVIKYTGMTADEVRELNEEFKKMDTRTGRDQLNALAGDAGRLGITGKEAVLDFVEAADMINVALGEDLGDDAVKNIGKLAQLFGDSDRMGLKQAMIATGSTINALGQSSSAAEGYIVDFAGRLSSMAKQAGMTQAEIMGLAAVMDQSMINAEEGSTALSKIIQKLYKEPAKMAKAVGLDVKQFTDLMKKDANAALLQFATAVSKMGGMDKIAPLLGDLKLTGAGVSKTLAAMASNIDLVKTTQQEATRAFEEGTSILDEYAKANNTPLAQQEKAIARFEELRIKLGEQLYPIWTQGIGLTSLMVQGLSALISFLSTYGKQVLMVVGAMASYKLVVIAHMALSKTWIALKTAKIALQNAWTTAIAAGRVAMIAYTYGMRGATRAAKAFTAATKLNPWGLLATIVTTVVASIWAFSDATEEATEKVDELKKIQEEAAGSTAQERSRIEQLTGIIRSNTAAYDEKKRAIEAIQRIIPGYNAELDKEGRLIKENTKAIDDYIKMLNAKALANAAEKAMTEINDELIQAEIKRDAKANNVAAVKRELKKAQYQKNVQTVRTQAGYRTVTHELDVNQEARVRKQQELALQEEAQRAAQAEVDAAKAKRDKVNAWLQSNPDVLKIFNSNVIEGDDTTDIPTNTPTGEDATKEAAKRIKEATEFEKLKLRLAFEAGNLERREYEEQILFAEEEMYKQLKTIYTDGSKEWTQAENGRLDTLKKLNATYSDWSIEDIERQEREETKELQKNYANGLMNEKQYREELERIQISYLRRKAEYSKGWGQDEEAQKYESQAEQIAMQGKLQRRQQYEQQAQQMQQQYLQKSIAERRQAENDLLTELIQAGVIAEEKEQEYRDAIKKKFDEEEKKEKTDDKWGNIGGQMDPMTNSIVGAMTAMDNLSQKIKDGKAQWSDYAGAAIGALGMVSAMMSSASNYMQACYQAEEAKVTKRYDAEIKAAGANTKKGKQLEEKKQKELAAMKAKYNKKAITIEIAQAVASTAMAAINAYASAAKVNFILGPIAAAAATAAGMLQIATIKKQHEAQAAGYYEGGFTGGTSYRREAGVVHQGEFVANHKAVNNPNVLPVLKMLDYAQRNNTIASVTAADIAKTVGTGTGQTVVAPVVVHETERTSEALERLNETLEIGIRASVSIDGADGIERQWTRYNQMKKRK